MDKTLKYFVFVLMTTFFSCSNERKPFSSAHNIIVKFSNGITFDYDSKVVILNFYDEEVLRDTLRFSEEEIKQIENTFFEKGIGDTEGKLCLGYFNEFPLTYNVFDILEDNKVKSSLHWESDYRKGRTSKEQRYVEFCIILSDIIRNKREFLKMTDIYSEKELEMLQYQFEGKKR